MAFNSLSGTVVVHPGSHLDASGSAVTATSLYTSGSKGAVYEEAGIKTYTCTDSKQWVSCSGSLLTSSLSTITLVCVDPPNTNLILTSGDIHNISPSGSINIGPAGTTRTSPTFLQFSGTLAFADHSYSGSYYSASCGTKTVDACTTVLTTTDGESTISVSGSLLSGSGGTTETAGGVTIHTSTDAESTLSTSGSFTTGSDGTTTAAPGIDMFLSTDFLHWTSTSGSYLTGALGAWLLSPALAEFASTDYLLWMSVSGSYLTGAAGYTSWSPAVGYMASTDYIHWTSVSGSHLEGAAGTTTISPGSVSSSVFYGDGSALYGIDATRLDITAGTDGMTLSLGLNYFTASTNPIKVYVPSGSYGDYLHIKTGPGVSPTNYVMITSSNAHMLNTFDGATTQKIESPYGSVSLVYVKDSDWRIL